MSKRKSVFAVMLMCSIFLSQSTEAAVVRENGGNITMSMSDILVIDSNVHTDNNENRNVISDINEIKNESPVLSSGSSVKSSDGNMIRRVGNIGTDDLAKLLNGAVNGKASGVLTKDDFYNLIASQNKEAAEKYKKERDEAKQKIKNQANAEDAQEIKKAVESLLNGVNPLTGKKFRSGGITNIPDWWNNDDNRFSDIWDKFASFLNGLKDALNENQESSDYHDAFSGDIYYEHMKKSQIEYAEESARNLSWSGIRFKGTAREVEGSSFQEDEWADETDAIAGYSALARMKRCHICGKYYGFYTACDCGKMFDGRNLEAYLKGEGSKKNDINGGQNKASNTHINDRNKYVSGFAPEIAVNSGWSVAETYDLYNAYNAFINQYKNRIDTTWTQIADELQDELEKQYGSNSGSGKPDDTKLKKLEDKQQKLITEQNQRMREKSEKINSIISGLDTKNVSEIAKIFDNYGLNNANAINVSGMEMVSNPDGSVAIRFDGDTDWTTIENPTKKKINSVKKEKALEKTADYLKKKKAISKTSELSSEDYYLLASYCAALNAEAKKNSDWLLISKFTGNTKEKEISSSTSDIDQYIPHTDAEKAAQQIDEVGLYAWSTCSSDGEKEAVVEELLKEQGVEITDANKKAAAKRLDEMSSHSYPQDDTAQFSEIVKKTGAGEDATVKKLTDSLTELDYLRIAGKKIVDGESDTDVRKSVRYVITVSAEKNGADPDEKTLNTAVDAVMKTVSDIGEVSGSKAYLEEICGNSMGAGVMRITTASLENDEMLDQKDAADDSIWLFPNYEKTNPRKKQVNEDNEESVKKALAESKGDKNSIVTGYKNRAICQESGKQIKNSDPDNIMFSGTSGKMVLKNCFQNSTDKGAVRHEDDAYTDENAVKEIALLYDVDNDTAKTFYKKTYNGHFTLKDKMEALNALDRTHADGCFTGGDAVKIIKDVYNLSTEEAQKVLKEDYNGALYVNPSLRSSPYYMDYGNADQVVRALNNEIEERKKQYEKSIEEGAGTEDSIPSRDILLKEINPFYTYDPSDPESVKQAAAEGIERGETYAGLYDTVYIDLPENGKDDSKSGNDPASTPHSLFDLGDLNPNGKTKDLLGNEMKKKLLDWLKSENWLDQEVPGAEALNGNRAADDFRNSQEYQDIENEIDGSLNNIDKNGWNEDEKKLAASMKEQFEKDFPKTWKDMLKKGVFDGTPFGNGEKNGTTKSPQELLNAIADYIASFTAISDDVNVTVTVENQSDQAESSRKTYQVRAGTSVKITDSSGEAVLDTYTGGSVAQAEFRAPSPGVYRCTKTAYVFDVTLLQSYTDHKADITITADDGTTVTISGCEYITYREDQNGLRYSKTRAYSSPDSYSITVNESAINFDLSGWFDTQRIR